MKIYDYRQQHSQLFVVGDIHGEIRTLVYNIKRQKIANSVVIIAGDCGIGFEKKGHYDNLYQKVSKTLEKNNCILILVRGNHDNPEYFEKELINFPYMKSVPDYSLIQVDTKNVLCIGGAISLDRTDRMRVMQSRKMKNKLETGIYWENEYPVYDEDKLSELKENDFKVNTVLTHTAPSFCFPKARRNFIHWTFVDENLKNDVKQERMIMDLIYNKLLSDNHPIGNWLYGHYHDSNTEIISNICFSLLNIDELKKIE